MSRKTHESKRSFYGAMVILSMLIAAMSVCNNLDSDYKNRYQPTEIACE